MPYCSVLCCKKRSTTSNFQKDGVTFHIFPKDENLKEIWKRNCNKSIDWVPTKNSAICSDHFKTSDFLRQNNRRKLIDSAIPILTPQCVCPCHPLAYGINDEASSTPTCTPNTSTKQVSVSPIRFNESLRTRKMSNQLELQKKKIKRLQAKNLYLRNKVARLKEVIENLDEKSSIDKEQR